MITTMKGAIVTNVNICGVDKSVMKAEKSVNDKQKDYVNSMINRVAEVMDTSSKLIKSDWRAKQMVYIRAAITQRVISEKGMHIVPLARIMRKDHSSICHYKRLMKDALDGFNPELKAVYERIKTI